jgi:hypothetical protein
MADQERHNPCNIRKTGEVFKGESLCAGAFKCFVDNAHGYRCAMKILKTYILKYKLNTIEKIIPRYAPSEENPTENYIKFVSDKSGFARDEVLTFERSYIIPIIAAMAHFEQGHEGDMDEIEEGWWLI